MTDELDRIEELAKAWIAVTPDNSDRTRTKHRDFEAAANPAAILRMTALIRQLKAENERMQEVLEPFAADHECDGHATVKDFDLEVAVHVKYSAILAARRAAQSLDQTERGEA